jgi:hypothetical protein
MRFGPVDMGNSGFFKQINLSPDQVRTVSALCKENQVERSNVLPVKSRDLPLPAGSPFSGSTEME